MSKIVLTDAYIALSGGAVGGSAVVSDHANKVTVTMDIDDVEVTTFGPSGFKEYAQGMADASIAVDFFQDFSGGGSAGLDPLLYTLWTSRGTFQIDVRPTSAAAGTANPVYKMTARLYNYSPLDGSSGAASNMTVNFRNGGTAGITRGTT